MLCLLSIIPTLPQCRRLFNELHHAQSPFLIPYSQAMLPPARTTEKTSTVFEESQQPQTDEQSPEESNSSPAANGHGRNAAEAFISARKLAIAHQSLKHGDR